MFKHKNEAESLKIDRFPCKKCGALLTFKPGARHLLCQYCGQKNPIEERFELIREYDFHQALVELSIAKPTIETPQIQCDACGASFKFPGSINAGECPFCGSEIVVGDDQVRPITPKSLLPFKLNEIEAKERFRAWLNGLWFAPSEFKKLLDDDAKWQGVYVPYWTYDSQTETLYQGARGKVHYVTERAQSYNSGYVRRETKQVPKVEWTPVQGKVARVFDDILVGASESLPRTIVDPLEPWDLDNLVPYDERYLSGFASETYQIGLDEGFDLAKRKMDNVIFHDIATAIGGDEQRIDRLHTQHSDTTFKHCLLPVWSASYYYNKKTYRFAINGRTGKVQGERPYSVKKIVLTILFGIIATVGVLFFLQPAGTWDSVGDRMIYAAEEFLFGPPDPDWDKEDLGEGEENAGEEKDAAEKEK